MSTPSDSVSGFEADCSDGRTAASRRVLVGLEANGLVITSPQGEAVDVWPYAELRAASPIDRQSADVLLRRSGASDSGATLYVARPDAIAALKAHAPHLTARAERWRFAKPGLAVFVLVAAAAAAIWAADVSASHVVANLVPDRVWRTVGGRAAESFAAGHRVCSEPRAVNALDRLMTKLTQAAGSTTQFKARVVDWDLLNAFALPGQQIVLTRKLIETVASADELAGVIAHEMGHGLERHPEAQIVRAVGLTVAAKFLFSGASETISNFGVLLLQLRYTREAERAADSHAVELLRKARIPARGLVEFFERLTKRDLRGRAGMHASPYEIFNTHPSLDERIAYARAQASYPSEPALPPEDEQTLRAICAQ